MLDQHQNPAPTGGSAPTEAPARRRITLGAVKRRLMRALRFTGFLICLPVLVPSVLVLRALAPIYLVRFRELLSSRIGHLAIEPEMYLARRNLAADRKRGIDLFYLDAGNLCNRQLARMWARKLCISRWVRPVHRANKLFPGWERHEIPWRDAFGPKDDELSRTSPHLTFTEDEIVRGEEMLRTLLGDRTGPIVCVFNRDPAYLDQHSPDRSWRYHDFRDAEIENYIPAMEWLAAKGYVVFRMGAVVKSPLPKDLHPNVIDYATLHRSDFMDIYLIHRCAFQIVASSGLANLGTVFRKAQAWANVVPLLSATVPIVHPEEIVMPKLYRCTREDRILSVKEIAGRDLTKTDTAEGFRSNSIEVVENDATDILNLAKELEGGVTGELALTDEDHALRRQFWTDVGWDTDLAAGCPQPSANFLRRHRDVLFDR